jgi:hypothetical protein
MCCYFDVELCSCLWLFLFVLLHYFRCCFWALFEQCWMCITWCQSNILNLYILNTCFWLHCALCSVFVGHLLVCILFWYLAVKDQQGKVCYGAFNWTTIHSVSFVLFVLFKSKLFSGVSAVISMLCLKHVKDIIISSDFYLSITPLPNQSIH